MYKAFDRCPRQHCGGVLVPDGWNADELLCLLCARTFSARAPRGTSRLARAAYGQPEREGPERVGAAERQAIRARRAAGESISSIAKDLRISRYLVKRLAGEK